MPTQFPRGAEWRIWDLQVHTPFSELNNGFGQDYDAYAKTFFTVAIQKNVAVVGVTDYFVVDGYRFLKELQRDNARLSALIGAELVPAAKAIRLFANVELRTDIIVDGARVNYHVIFSDELSAEDITDTRRCHHLRHGGVFRPCALVVEREAGLRAGLGDTPELL